ncbi:stage II sporulation protein P [Neobittarella massiliensis]|uniref:Stage II sporulation protein P n=1 Tax=uncultured Anaerotruncus sp. TaxID=905011 RepID=A0A1C6JEC5_9FIRM|nr:stage II sporulation protein P [Neobittarella massiliensis]SCJ80318.1 stage II sporulation protein P [uncultured Anaerotruncus sp.]
MARRSRTRIATQRKKRQGRGKVVLAALTLVLLTVYGNLDTLVGWYQKFAGKNVAIGSQVFSGLSPSENRANRDDDEGTTILEKDESWTDFKSLLPPQTEPAAPADQQRPEGALPIETVNLSTKKGIPYKSGAINNKTEMSAEQVLSALSDDADFKIQLGASEPQVLIVHTHATESYENYDLGYYDPGAASRNEDNAQNMTRVGEALVAQLNAAGICAIQDKTQHDNPQYTGAYDRSRITVQEYLKKYPSIKVVIDVHRDAIQYSDGTRAKPTAQIEGKNAAQIMMIVGCNTSDNELPGYAKNLRFAADLQDVLETSFPDLTRPILFDYRFYNQDLTPANILIEVGGHANTLGEAVYSGELIGRGLAQYLKARAG